MDEEYDAKRKTFLSEFEEFMTDIIQLYQEYGFDIYDAYKDEGYDFFMNILPFIQVVELNSLEGKNLIKKVLKYKQKWGTRTGDNETIQNYMNQYIDELSINENDSTPTIKDFVEFVTGSRAIPTRIEYEHRNLPSSNKENIHFPEAHTCFNALEVPFIKNGKDYYDKFKERFDTSLKQLKVSSKTGGYSLLKGGRSGKKTIL
jgi:hypothetical protein